MSTKKLRTMWEELQSVSTLKPYTCVRTEDLNNRFNTTALSQQPISKKAAMQMSTFNRNDIGTITIIILVLLIVHIALITRLLMTSVTMLISSMTDTAMWLG